MRATLRRHFARNDLSAYDPVEMCHAKIETFCCSLIDLKVSTYYAYVIHLLLRRANTPQVPLYTRHVFKKSEKQRDRYNEQKYSRLLDEFGCNEMVNEPETQYTLTMFTY